ncbi:MAG: hypothetical protein KZQ75_13650 [Candidatus Thiodiazotropha sp. (ex Myrtea spinifera)]|nr:hypothetical protein [Candidatus Thiodiazotropha sp. (ex Myrtea spinifera)]
MLFPGLDLNYIGQQFESAAPAVVEASRASGSGADSADHSPAMLEQAMLRLLELLTIVESRSDMSADLSQHDIDLNELGDYAIQLLSDLSSVAGSLNMAPQSQSLEDLTLPMALWIARHEGELRTLEPVVNALSRMANTLREPSALAQLYEVTSEVHRATGSLLRQDLEKQNPGRPWRLLLMNQAIIATRSHQTELIDEAYQVLVEALPEEALRFFEEGMQQMEALNYPEVVRQVVEKYYNLWNIPKTLH